MIAFRSSTRLLSNTLSSSSLLDLRERLTVGEASRVSEILIASSADLPGSSPEVIKNKMHSSIERLTASMIDRQSHVSDQTAGFYVTADPVTFAPSSGNCVFKAEVTEVTPTEATFLIEVRDAKSGAMITTAEYERVVIGEPYRPRLLVERSC
jgi:hypothetical protein